VQDLTPASPETDAESEFVWANVNSENMAGALGLFATAVATFAYPDRPGDLPENLLHALLELEGVEACLDALRTGNYDKGPEFGKELFRDCGLPIGDGTFTSCHPPVRVLSEIHVRVLLDCHTVFHRLIGD
jgi:hypothetical protein